MRHLTLNLLALAVLAGCPASKDPKQTALTAKAISPSAARPSPSVPDAGASAESANFEVRMLLPATMTVGSPSQLSLELRAKSGFHLNEEYPIHFRPEGSTAGLRFERERYDLKGGAQLSPCPEEQKDACQLRAQVPLTAVQAGTERAAGVLAFSVCNPDQCLIEKIPLAVSTVVQ